MTVDGRRVMFSPTRCITISGVVGRGVRKDMRNNSAESAQKLRTRRFHFHQTFTFSDVRFFDCCRYQERRDIPSAIHGCSPFDSVAASHSARVGPTLLAAPVLPLPCQSSVLPLASQS
jgi:hypothetical protein